MKKEQYIPYIEQREQLLVDALAAAGKPMDGGKLPDKCTITTNGQEYKVTPIKTQTAAAYRKRFMQVDAAAKGMLQRQGYLGQITVELAGRQYVLDPTPEQEREQESLTEIEAATYIYKELQGKKHRDPIEQSLWEQLDACFKEYKQQL